MDEVSKNYIDKVTDKVIGKLDNPTSETEPQFNPVDMEVNVLSYALSPGPFELTDKHLPPSFWENFGNQFMEHEELAAGYRLANKALPDNNAPDISKEIIPEGWSSAEVSNIEDLDERYWNYVLESGSPKDLEYRREKAMKQMEHDQRLAEGGAISSILGGGLGAILSPSTLLFPLGKIPAAGKLSAHVLKGVLKAAPKIAAQGFLHEAIVEAGRLESDPVEALINGARDTAFGLAFYGAGRGISFGTRASNIWQARKIVDHTFKGVTTKIHVDDAGLYKGLIAEAIPGQIVKDTELAAAQAFLDNGAAFSGLSVLIGGINKIPLFGSPLIQGLTSTSTVVRKFYNRMANQSIVVGRIERGLARELTVEEVLDDITKLGRQNGVLLQDLYVQSLGLKPGLVNNARAVIQGIKDGGISSSDAFYTQVLRSIYTGEHSAIKQVNEAAKIWGEFSDSLFKEYLRLYDLPENILPPKTSKNYATRIYNLNELVRNPDGWRNTIVGALQAQDKKIVEYMRPINTLKQSLRSLNQELALVKGKDAKPIESKIRKTKKVLKAQQKELMRQMQDGEIDLVLLDGRPFLTNTQLVELNTLLKPVTTLETKIKNAVEELPGLTRNEQKASRARIKDLRAQKLELLESLRLDAANGKIDSALFYTKGNKIKFHVLEPNLKFRDLYASPQAMAQQADGARNAILGQSPEQITQEMFGFASGGTVTNPTLARTLLVPDIDLLNNNFLSPNMPRMMDLYSRNLGKKIALKSIFADMNWSNGITDMVEALTAENAARVKRIETEFPVRTAARDAKLSKVDADFKKNKALIEKGYNFFMGSSKAHPDAIKYGRNLRNLTAISMLKRVPLLQGVDAIGMAFKQGLWPSITGGLVPLFRRIGSEAARAEARAGSTHARVGLEMHMQRLGNALYEGAPTDQMVGGFSSYLNTVANASSTIFGTNFITNSLQEISAGITQSRVMADMFAHSRGKLGQAGINRLLMNGIDPKDAKRFIEAYKKAGGYKSFGGHVSNWWLWEDVALGSQMRRAIQNDITGSILKPGVFDKPFWSRDPILGLPAQFLGYSYAAFNKLLIPLFQQPDGNKIAAYSMMLYYGSWIEPLRKWSKGEEFEIEDEKGLDQWFWQAASDSGVLGFPAELLNTATALLDPAFLDRWKTDKFRRRPLSGLLAGPIGGYGQNIADIGQMFLDGTINQSGLIKLLNTIPVAIPLPLDYAFREGLKRTDIPETKRDASYYSWVDKD